MKNSIKRKMKRRLLGTTGMSITEVSLGAMNIRLLDTEEEGIALVKKALDLGINLIDTARAYRDEKSDGRLIESEVVVGKAVAQSNIVEPLIIITKGHGYTPSIFVEELNTSRDKLGIEGMHNIKIGNQDVKLIYFFHGLTQKRWQDMKDSDVLKTALKMKEQGWFHYLGFSSHNGNEECIYEAFESGYFEVIELPYNVFSPGLSDIISTACKKGVGVINMKAFGGNGMVMKTKMFEDYCDIPTKKRLQFCLANPDVTTVDVGCKTIAELEEDIETSMCSPLSNMERALLLENADRVTKSTAGTCRECMHCLEKFECPKGIVFPEILSIHTKLQIATEFEGDIEQLKLDYGMLKDEAEKCVACGACNEWCEYGLDIPKLIEETKQKLGN